MIVVAGDVATDVLAVLDAAPAPASDTRAAIRFTGGGQAANTATWLATEGHAVTFAGAVGDDDAGRTRVAELRAAGVLPRVSVHSGTATGCVIVLVRDGERTMITDRGANRLLDTEGVQAAIDDGARHVHVSGYPLLDAASRPAALRILRMARQAKLTTSVDAASAAPLRVAGPAFLDWIEGVDVLLANTLEAETLVGPGTPEDQAAELARSTGGAAVLKRGADGAVWSDGEHTRTAAAEPVRVVDPTGAGDAFAAGFLGAWTSGHGVDAALAAGCRLGARAVAHVGAR